MKVIKLLMGWFFFVILIFAHLACQPDEAKEKEEIKWVLEHYVQGLSKAYTKQNPALLKPFAAPLEVNQVRQFIKKLRYEGYALKPTLQNLTITYMDIYNGVNAFAKTVEVWQVTLVNAHTGEVVRKAMGQVLHVTYQLKKWDREGWMITSRIPEETKKRPW